MEQLAAVALLALISIVLAACVGCRHQTSIEAQPAEIAYGNHSQQRLDVIHSPKQQPTARGPAIMLVHGGGWMDGSKEDLTRHWAMPFVERGFTVINVEYRTGRHSPAPAAILDVRAAAARVCREAARYRIDPRRLVFAGFSAGAHLALMAALPPVDSAEFGPSCNPAAVVSFWGITDVAELLTDGPSRRDFAESWVRGSWRGLADRLSPVFWVRAGLPPVLTIHAKRDGRVPFAQAERLTRLLQKAGGRAELAPWDASWHAPEEAAVRTAVLDRAFAFIEFLRRDVRQN